MHIRPNRDNLIHPEIEIAFLKKNYKKKRLEMLGIEPRTSRMRSERSTPELHPRVTKVVISATIFSYLHRKIPVKLPVKQSEISNFSIF